jgi:hypothetical protein
MFTRLAILGILLTIVPFAAAAPLQQGTRTPAPALLIGGQETKPATAAPAALEGQMIIWSGAKTEAEAKTQFEVFKSYANALEDFVKVAPQVIESATVQGLKPGFFVVALGVCSAKDKDADFPLRLFQGIEPAVYTREVQYKPEDSSEAPDCPTAGQAVRGNDGEPIPWELGTPVRTAVESGTLVALPFSYDWSEQGDFARKYYGVRVELLLVGPARKLLATSQSKSPSDAASLTSISAAGRGISWKLEYAKPPCDPRDDRFISWSQSFSATAQGGAIALGKRPAVRLKSGTCGYADERKAISGHPKRQ